MDDKYPFYPFSDYLRSACLGRGMRVALFATSSRDVAMSTFSKISWRVSDDSGDYDGGDVNDGEQRQGRRRGRNSRRPSFPLPLR